MCHVLRTRFGGIVDAMCIIVNNSQSSLLTKQELTFDSNCKILSNIRPSLCGLDFYVAGVSKYTIRSTLDCIDVAQQEGDKKEAFQ